MQIALTVILWTACQTPPAELPRKGNPPTGVRRDIDFWGTACPKSQVQRPKSGRKPAGTRDPEADIRHLESVFAEPIRMPDGRFAIYVPPKPVLEFLEEPTKESARGYLAWQDLRARKISDAMRILEELQRDESKTASPDVPSPKSLVPESRPTILPKSEVTNRSPVIRLTYFRQPN